MNYKNKIQNGKQANEPATPPTPVVEPQPTQPQAEQEVVKVEPMESSGINVNPDEIFAKQRESFVENSAEAAKKEGYAKIDEMIQANNASTAKQKTAELEEKRRNRARIFNAIGDGVSALANLYFTSQGAPSVQYDPRGSLSARAQERWDKMDELRKAEEHRQYLREKEKREQELRRAREERLEQQNAALNTYRQESLANKREIEELRGRIAAQKAQQSFENQQQLNDAKHQNTLVQIDARGKNASNLEKQKQAGREKIAETKAKASKDEAAKATAEAFYSLPEDVQNQIRKSYGKDDDKEEITIKQMEEALIKYNAKKEPKTKANYDQYKVTATSKKDYSKYQE